MNDPLGAPPVASDTQPVYVYRWIPLSNTDRPYPDSGREVMELIDENPPGISSRRLIEKSGLSNSQVHKQLLSLRANGFITGINRPGRTGFEIHWVRSSDKYGLSAQFPAVAPHAAEVLAALQDSESGLSLDELVTLLSRPPTALIHILAELKRDGFIVRTLPGTKLPTPRNPPVIELAPRSRIPDNEPALIGDIESIIEDSPVGMVTSTVAAVANAPINDVTTVLHQLYADERIGGTRFAGNTDQMLWLPRAVHATAQTIVDSVAEHIEGARIADILNDTNLPADRIRWQLEALHDHLLVDHLRLSPHDPQQRWYLVRHTSKRRHQPRLAPAQALAAVHQRPGLTCPALAKLLECSPTYLSTQLRALRKAGHVRWYRGGGPTTWFPA